jgi:hypothetical protein
MRDFAAALLGGPRWMAPKDGRRAGGPGWLVLPLGILACVFVLTALAGVAALGQAALAGFAARAIPASALCATVCVALAIPAVLAAPLWLFALPVWVWPVLVAAGWALLPGWGVAAAALPLVVVVLAGAWGERPVGLAEAAATAGACPWVAFRIGVLGPRWPGLVWAWGVGFALSLRLY